MHRCTNCGTKCGGNRQFRLWPICSLPRMNPHSRRERSGGSPCRLAGHVERFPEVVQTVERPRPGSRFDPLFALGAAGLPATDDTGSTSRAAILHAAVAAFDDMWDMTSPGACCARGISQRAVETRATAHIHPVLAPFEIHNTGDTMRVPV